MELSVIILNYKVPAHLLLCVDSVIKAVSGIKAEIIVADNNSQDESLRLLSQFFPSVKQIPIPENLGFSKGNNIAIQHAKGHYICLLNPDTVIPENCFKEALQFAEKYPNLGALGIQLIDGSGNFLPESKRNIPTPKVAMAKLCGFDKSYYANHLTKNQIGEVSILVGAFMLMQKERYIQVGGLDEAYFMYGEDIDLSYQFLKNGFQNYYLGSLSCLHFKGESTIKDKSFRNRFFGAMQLFYKKHFKTNAFSVGLVSVGLKLAQQLSLGVATKKEFKTQARKLFLVSDSQSLLQNLIKEYECVLISEEELLQLKPQNALLVFDATYLGYAEIILFMRQLKRTPFKFRIIPRMQNLMLGSDQSTQQGAVKFLSLENKK